MAERRTFRGLNGHNQRPLQGRPIGDGRPCQDRGLDWTAPGNQTSQGSRAGEIGAGGTWPRLSSFLDRRGGGMDPLERPSTSKVGTGAAALSSIASLGNGSSKVVAGGEGGSGRGWFRPSFGRGSPRGGVSGGKATSRGANASSNPTGAGGKGDGEAREGGSGMTAGWASRGSNQERTASASPPSPSARSMTDSRVCIP
jgi:hypothetical protein